MSTAIHPTITSDLPVYGTRSLPSTVHLWMVKIPLTLRLKRRRKANGWSTDYEKQARAATGAKAGYAKLLERSPALPLQLTGSSCRVTVSSMQDHHSARSGERKYESARIKIVLATDARLPRALV